MKQGEKSLHTIRLNWIVGKILKIEISTNQQEATSKPHGKFNDSGPISTLAPNLNENIKDG